MPIRRNLPPVRGIEPQELPRAERRRSLLPRRRLANRAGMVRTSCALPQPLHEDLKIAAVRLNWSLAAVLHDAALYWLARHIATLDRRSEEHTSELQSLR